MDFVKLHEQILVLDPKIRFATIFDTSVRIIQSGHHEGLTSIIIPLDKENILYVTTYIDVDPFSAITKLTKLIQQ